MKIGFIGLGAMGRNMAANLQRAGHHLKVYDVRREAAAELVSQGTVWSDGPAQAASDVEVLFTCLPGPAEVESVALGDGGVLSAMDSGSVWFDLTTNAPDVVRRLHAVFAARGIRMLDAPISGGPKGAQSRRLAFWVGGDAATFEQQEPLLKAMGDEPLYVGPVGAGSVAKLVHNCANFAVQIALAEVFTLGVKAGVDPLVLFRALRQGTTGRSRTFDPPGRAVPARCLRSTVVRAATRTEGHAPRHRVGTHARRADADGNCDAGNYRGDATRLG